MAESDSPRSERTPIAAGEVRQEFASKAEGLRSGAEERAEEWTSGVGERAGHVADALRSAEDSLRGKEDWLADAAAALSRNLSELADSARAKGFKDIKSDLEGMARDRPALFLGAAVAAGVAFGRILRSSAREEQAPPEQKQEPSSPSGTTATASSTKPYVPSPAPSPAGAPGTTASSESEKRS